MQYLVKFRKIDKKLDKNWQISINWQILTKVLAKIDKFRKNCQFLKIASNFKNYYKFWQKFWYLAKISKTVRIFKNCLKNFEKCQKECKLTRLITGISNTCLVDENREKNIFFEIYNFLNFILILNFTSFCLIRNIERLFWWKSC